MIGENVKAALREIEGGNPFGEKITLVAATKTRTPEEINEAVEAGIEEIGENRVQEFRDKFGLVTGAKRDFIGHLQTNKVKYLVGKCDLLHSLDRDELAEELSSRCVAAEKPMDALIQVNIGNEESKGGYPFEDAWNAFLSLRKREGIRVKGFMAMLPVSDDTALLKGLCDRMRALFERARDADGNIKYLSMGMSGDWRLCVGQGSNMIRLGTALFGEREYK